MDSSSFTRSAPVLDHPQQPRHAGCCNHAAPQIPAGAPAAACAAAGHPPAATASTPAAPVRPGPAQPVRPPPGRRPHHCRAVSVPDARCALPAAAGQRPTVPAPDGSSGTAATGPEAPSPRAHKARPR
ncbi:hypothetical protein G6F60_014774 [Rhizopus arrhizus]|nr:hypothetical protein G6F60_014774 [Rhizopus arrhizus]